MSHYTRCLNYLGQNKEYVVQAFKVLKNLVHAEANVRAQKTGFFAAFAELIQISCLVTYFCAQAVS